MTSAVKTRRIPARLEQTQRILVVGFKPGSAPVPAPPLPPQPEPPVVLPAKPRGYRGRRRAAAEHPVLAFLSLGFGLGFITAAASIAALVLS
jgi:hypothetical protein